ncbi:MAG: 3-hydroxyacyl-CoA dehydrogenase family protein, partial [Aeoliella sp.]
RLGYAIYREAIHLIEQGVAGAEKIDRALRHVIGTWSTFCGRLRWIDITGGPLLHAKAMTPVLPTLSNATEVPALLRDLASSAADGIKSGKGFYIYTQAEAQLWEERLREQAWRTLKLDLPEHPREDAP